MKSTKTDWLLSIAGFSFFGWLLFGLLGLVVGPSYLLLVLTFRKILISRESHKNKTQFEKMLTNTIGHARNEPCTCKRLQQFPNETCRWQDWEKAELLRMQNKIYSR
jgi:hypothetical protein